MKRRYYRKRKYKRRRPGLAKLKRQVKAIAARSELKYQDTEAQTLQIHSTPANPNLLNVLVKGQDEDDRIGDKVKLKRLFIRGYIDNSTGAVSQDAIMRLVIFRFKTQKNSRPGWTDIFEAASVNSAIKMRTKKEFKIYVDETFTMRATSEDNSQKYLVFKFNIPLNSIQEYTDTQVDYRDIYRNGLWIIAIGSQVAANYAQATYNARVTYYDG